MSGCGLQPQGEVTPQAPNNRIEKVRCIELIPAEIYCVRVSPGSLLPGTWEPCCPLQDPAAGPLRNRTG